MCILSLYSRAVLKLMKELSVLVLCHVCILLLTLIQCNNYESYFFQRRWGETLHRMLRK